jgi:hypothetical protein
MGDTPPLTRAPRISNMVGMAEGARRGVTRTLLGATLRNLHHDQQGGHRYEAFVSTVTFLAGVARMSSCTCGIARWMPRQRHTAPGSLVTPLTAESLVTRLR